MTALLKRLRTGLSGGFVLAFHDIAPDRLSDLVESLHPARAVSLTDLIDRSKRGQPTSGLFAITVDDGVGETVRNLSRLFSTRGWPGTFYLCTQYVDSTEAMAFQWWRKILPLLPPKTLSLKSGPLNLSKEGAIQELSKKMEAMWHSQRLESYLPLIRELAEVASREYGVDLASIRPPDQITWSEVAQLSSNELISFESHGVSHAAVSTLTEPELLFEMKHSRNTISSYTGRQCRHFAYPFGSERSIGSRAAAVAQLFYDSASTMSLGGVDGANPWLLPRIPLYPENPKWFASLKILLTCNRVSARSATRANYSPAETGRPHLRGSLESETGLDWQRFTVCYFGRGRTMIISVIIPCRNERAHIAEFLDSLMGQSCESDWNVEILVADGLSNDGTRDVLQRYMEKAPNVRMIDNPGRIVSTGLNAAIAASTGEIIIRMDAHTTYARDYIHQCVSVLQESGADNVGGPWVAGGHGLIGTAIAVAFQSPFCAGGGRAHNPGYEGDVDTVYLGCWRRSAFDRFGMFDPALVRNQDDEFNFRIRQQGGRIVQSPRIQSTYIPRSSITSLFRQYLQYGFWKVAVIRKHGAIASWRHVIPALFVASLLGGMITTSLAAVLGKTTVAIFAGGILSAELLLYALACLTATLPLVRSLKWPVLVAIPGVIAVHQVSYGLGFLMGLLKAAGPHSRAPQPARAFTALTR